LWEIPFQSLCFCISKDEIKIFYLLEIKSVFCYFLFYEETVSMDQRPEVINDRGRQMKAEPIKRMFEDHHMPRLFARPRTPNDNPFVESLLALSKGHHSILEPIA